MELKSAVSWTFGTDEKHSFLVTTELSAEAKPEATAEDAIKAHVRQHVDILLNEIKSHGGKPYEPPVPQTTIVVPAASGGQAGQAQTQVFKTTSVACRLPKDGSDRKFWMIFGRPDDTYGVYAPRNTPGLPDVVKAMQAGATMPLAGYVCEYSEGTKNGKTDRRVLKLEPPKDTAVTQSPTKKADEVF